MKNIWKDRVKVKQENKTIQERRDKLMESINNSDGIKIDLILII
jgi:hypothetical protein